MGASLLAATVATRIVLSILGIPFALSLGFVVGFLDLIPLVGATMGAIVGGVATVTVDFPTATILWVAFIVVWQRFEDDIVRPMVYGKALKVNPIVTILSVLAGGRCSECSERFWPSPPPPQSRLCSEIGGPTGLTTRLQSLSRLRMNGRYRDRGRGHPAVIVAPRLVA